MAEVPFRPACQLSEYNGKGASASREAVNYPTSQKEGRPNLIQLITLETKKAAQSALFRKIAVDCQ